MENSKIEIINMTGQQWGEILYRSGINKKDLPGILNIAYGTIFNYEKLQFVPEKGERALKKAAATYPKLKEAMEDVLSKTKERPTPAVQDHQLKSTMDIMQMLAQTMIQPITESVARLTNSITQNNETLSDLINRREKDFDLIKQNNSDIRKYADTFEAIVQEGIKQGAIVFQSPKNR